MSKILTLTLNAHEIKLAVKSDSYITGQIDKSADMVKNAALAFNEQAGDEQYHEMKLHRTMKGALAKLEAQIAEYVETSDQNASVVDNLTSSTSGTFWVKITVGNRTSAAFVDTMAYLAQEYIINMMLYTWWQPIKPSLAKDYIGFSADNLLDIKRCLSKSAPSASGSSYDDIHGSVEAQSSLSFPQSEYYTQLGSVFPTPTLSKFPSNATVGYSSSNESVATVNASTGAVSILSAGNVVITASFAGDDSYGPASASYTIHVTAAQSSLSFPNSEYSAQIGQPFTEPVLTKIPSDAVVTYSSSNGNVATVNSGTGEVTIIAGGDVVITASFAGGGGYAPASASYILHVGKAQSSLSFPQSEYTKELHEAFPMPELTKIPANADVTYSSSDRNVAEISGNEIESESAGDAVITASFAGDETYGPASASFTLHVQKDTPSLFFANSEYTKTVGTTFTPTLHKNPSYITVTFSSSDPSVASVDSSTGEVTTLTDGSDAVITASFAGDETYGPATAQCTVHVGNPTPTPGGE